MKVTDVIQQKNNNHRVSVFVDNEYAFSLDGADALMMKIKPGRELSVEDIERCKWECNYTKARDKALDVLSRKPISESELRGKLIEKGYDDEVAQKVMEELEGLGYVNDYDYGTLFLEHCLSKMWGKKKIRFEMRQKGLSDTIINELLADYEESDMEDEVTELIISKYSSYDFSDIKTKAKITRYFASRGFDFSLIDRCIRKAKEELYNE